MQQEIQRLRSHASHAVGRIERDLETKSTTDVSRLADSEWLPDYWKKNLAQSKKEAPHYAAIVDTGGNVVLHSEPGYQGRRLTGFWYDQLILEAGPNVVETKTAALTSGESALDVGIPIVVDDVEVGEYHTGFDLKRFNKSAMARSSKLIRNWTTWLVATVLVVGMAVISVYYLATHSVILRRVIDRSYVERNAEISQLAAGLAHEIRNPLHAIRLNLHTFQRAQTDSSRISDNEVGRMLDQSNREIDRIDRLMQALVGFATPEEAREEEIDVSTEIHSVVDFIRQGLLQKKINLQLKLPPGSVSLRMDPGRFRQIMLNLIHNAVEALNDGGHIEIGLSTHGGSIQLEVSDDGPGVSDADRKRIFEPFFTTKNNGTGLGLALVKRFVEEVDGEISCESNPAGGMTFRILLKEIPKPQKWSQRR
jgi:signal transduction histidine kinase